jgi:hypothetical protein
MMMMLGQQWENGAAISRGRGDGSGRGEDCEPGDRKYGRWTAASDRSHPVSDGQFKVGGS